MAGFQQVGGHGLSHGAQSQKGHVHFSCSLVRRESGPEQWTRVVGSRPIARDLRLSPWTCVPGARDSAPLRRGFSRRLYLLPRGHGPSVQSMLCRCLHPAGRASWCRKSARSMASVQAARPVQSARGLRPCLVRRVPADRPVPGLPCANSPALDPTEMFHDPSIAG